MNLTQPPFDDIHVRKAMNWIIDKAALRQAWGGPTIGTIANHIVPDTLFNFQLQEYEPYKTPGDHGSVAKAKAAMKGSKYDTNGDGTCSAAACKNVLLISDTRAVDPGMVADDPAGREEDRDHVQGASINGAYPTIQTPSKNIPIAERPGWGKDYADALTFFNPLFDGRTIIPTGNTNYSLVGITPAQCKTLKVTGNCTNVPSVDKQIDKCAAADRRPAHQLLREPRQEPDDEGRAVGAVALVVRDPHHEHERDAVRSSTSSATTPACPQIAVK